MEPRKSPVKFILWNWKRGKKYLAAETKLAKSLLRKFNNLRMKEIFGTIHKVNSF